MNESRPSLRAPGGDGSTPDAAWFVKSWLWSCCSAACMYWDPEWEPPGTEKVASGYFHHVLLRMVPMNYFVLQSHFNGHDIYNTRPFRSLSMKVWLHSAHMFIYIISGLSAVEVFISNKPCGVWFSLSAHAPMKLDFSCSAIRTSFCLC